MARIAPRDPVVNAEPPSNNVAVYLENGRYYGSYRMGKYMFPCDEHEKERLDIFHKFFSVARKGALHSAPVHNQENPRILDVGTGTGIWAIDMADKFPRGTVRGVDLSLIQPLFIPINLRFDQMDVEGPWQGMEPDSWDLIHMRALNGSISNWPRLYSEIFRHCRPHYGHIEQVEIDWMPRSDDGSLPNNAVVRQWATQLYDAMDQFDRPMRVDSGLTRRRLAEAGFTDIREEIIRVAYSGWPSDPHDRETGRWFNIGITQGIQAITLAPLFRGGGKTQQEIQTLIDSVVAEVRGRKVHAYCTV
ncbi:hypothetical protein QBC46DRAFT_361711 [Diplogelasinospora grovesii]|uniref:Methyltransferase LaeA n=1 Tax=Diplogelasinospora grovesii TaxID=303347 RepID=A0AAN6NDD8_9PEZI|nr:hypothetical protein QBC46DRAFT_361711 [Diplogelasinospora grovesii]